MNILLLAVILLLVAGTLSATVFKKKSLKWKIMILGMPYLLTIYVMIPVD